MTRKIVVPLVLLCTLLSLLRHSSIITANKSAAEQDMDTAQTSTTNEYIGTDIQAASSKDGLLSNARLISNASGIDIDSAESVTEILEELGITGLRKAERPNNAYRTTRIVDSSGRTYTLEFSKLGYIEVIRTEDGTIIWGAID